MRKWIATMAAVLMVMTAGTAMAADTANVDVTAAVAPACAFSSTPTLDFGTLDQASAADATAAGNLVFWCTTGAVYTLTDQNNPLVVDGAYPGTLISGGDTIPYTIAYTNTSGLGGGFGVPIASALTATIVNADYVGSPPGVYTETVTFTITP